MSEKAYMSKIDMALKLSEYQWLDKEVQIDSNILDREDANCLKHAATQSFINSSSRYIAKFLSSVIFQNEDPDNFEKLKESLFLKIMSFFSYIRQYGKLSGSELIYTTFLVQKFVESEIEQFNTSKRSIIISDGTVGTILVCAMVLAMKILRDVVEYNNKCWSQAFGMSIELLNQSEITFYVQLGFDVALPESQFIRLFQKIKSYTDV
ncbi:MAG: hypothetical protein EZS28_050801 [Streblomastix strix]|uniref:Cyclin N-terminal domain-containing protein n=1 Tax=Streblomastix strix TaxID=222440 RepID=A0A5J4T6R3_9EUKA|nr:MAG: hypothetical protein EZS28_050801 [Streblomastix strix]